MIERSSLSVWMLTAGLCWTDWIQRACICTAVRSGLPSPRTPSRLSGRARPWERVCIQAAQVRQCPANPVPSYNVSYAGYKGATFDASTTNLTYSIPAPGKHSNNSPLTITLSFLSPVTPQSTLRQAIPAAYLTILVEGDFDVDVYVDLNGQWVSGDRGSRIEWEHIKQDFNGNKGLKTWKVKRQNEELFTEKWDRAEWGTLYFSGPEVRMSYMLLVVCWKLMCWTERAS
jgi:hypothetical protein